MRRWRVVALLATLSAVMVVLPHGGAFANQTAPVQVQTLNYVFIPDPVRIQPGQTVRWVNPVFRSNHTATSYAPLSLWDSGEIEQNGTYTFTFTAAGSYDYLCTIHERFNMVSTVQVADKVSPPSGPAGTIFRVLVASEDAPTDYVYDIQMKNPGGIWRGWQVGVTAAAAQFDSTGLPPGAYRFRSRLHRISDDAASDYSPAVSVSVTGAASPTAPTTIVPFNRAQASMAFDERRHVTLMFGGEYFGAFMNDTWAWNGTKWALQFPRKSPSPRGGQGMVYDPVRREVVMFGGYDGNAYLNDTWVWNGRSWKLLSPALSPQPRANLGMVWDAALQRVVLFGGGSQTILNDTWTWDGTNWTKLSPATLPPKRSDLAMAYDVVQQNVIMFGGQGSTTLGDTWIFDGTNWTKQTPAITPDARWGPGMAWDRVRNQIVLFGGEGADFFPRGDTWTWDGSAWTQQSPASSPVERFRMPMEWSPIDQVILFGGVGADSYGDTWTWTGTTWIQH